MHIEVDFEGCVSIQGWLSMVIWDINSESLFKVLQDEVKIQLMPKVFIRDFIRFWAKIYHTNVFMYFFQAMLQQ